MKSVILVTPNTLDLSASRDVFSSVGHAYLQAPNRLIVEGEWGWFALEADDSLREDLAESGIANMAARLQTLHFAQLEYRNHRAADLAVELMPVSEGSLIDDDHGNLVAIDEIRDRIRTGKEWLPD